MTDRHKLFLGLFILLSTGLFGLWKWSELSALKLQATQLQIEASNLESVSKTLADEYQSIKMAVDTERETHAQELSEVFPYEEDLTTLIRLFDEYAVKNSFASNPFFIQSISYNQTLETESSNYRVVPIYMSIESSKKNLNKFFEMIESSGSLEAGVRLMSIENVTIDYPSEYGGTYDARLELYAYFAPAL